jgi:Ca2+-binding RTX toxin-like protein
MRRATILVVVMALLLSLTAGVALAKNINGNNRANTLIGTKNNDVIKGFGAGDYINGRAGNDDMYGQKGADEIEDFRGADRAWGGRGNDEIDVQDGVNNDRVSCGKGAHDVAIVDDGDRIFNKKACETIIDDDDDDDDEDDD